jgi:hypothetical protein
MPVRGMLYLSVSQPLCDIELSTLRSTFISELGIVPENDLRVPGISWIEAEFPEFLPEPSASWYESNLVWRYYGPGYEQGSLPSFVRCAEWLEKAVPNAGVWYGDDISDESIQPFGPDQRGELMEYYRRIGHDPSRQALGGCRGTD